ncbi:hypothetical protein [uncultured Paludibaculum sp.]|uniref:hypothetical protein n=1 Tax=uncultured Paludibaculum sp. TaxID=1765020 RepID=UPI002AABE352|nr:hypothetical protein [uncultured Paludibaculum sp.]
MDTVVKRRGTARVALDLGDADQGALARYSGRISKLLSLSEVMASPDLAASLDDLLGGVYGLVQAIQFGFVDRLERPIQISAVQKRATQLAAGNVRTDGKWVAGYCFNNALFRIAAVLHRVLKIVTGERRYVPVLIPEAQRLYPHWRCEKLNVVHSQVNDLKHTPLGAYEQRSASFADAIASVDELLQLLEFHLVPSTRATDQPTQ